MSYCKSFVPTVVVMIHIELVASRKIYSIKPESEKVQPQETERYIIW